MNNHKADQKDSHAAAPWDRKSAEGCSGQKASVKRRFRSLEAVCGTNLGEENCDRLKSSYPLKAVKQALGGITEKSKSIFLALFLQFYFRAAVFGWLLAVTVFHPESPIKKPLSNRNERSCVVKLLSVQEY